MFSCFDTITDRGRWIDGLRDRETDRHIATDSTVCTIESIARENDANAICHAANDLLVAIVLFLPIRFLKPWSHLADLEADLSRP